MALTSWYDKVFDENKALHGEKERMLKVLRRVRSDLFYFPGHFDSGSEIFELVSELLEEIDDE